MNNFNVSEWIKKQREILSKKKEAETNFEFNHGVTFGCYKTLLALEEFISKRSPLLMQDAEPSKKCDRHMWTYGFTHSVCHTCGYICPCENHTRRIENSTSIRICDECHQKSFA